MTKIDIISDPICPWCYIGKAKLDRAFAARPGHKFEVEWHPFQLNPEMPPEGMDRRDYLEAKFGGRAGAIEVYTSIANAAEAAGLTVNFEKIGRTPNTVDAHRLIHWAGLEGVQSAVVNKLFNAYFVDGLDISDHQVLVEIAISSGIDGEMIAKLLAQDADQDGILKRDAYAREKGVRGVPCFIVDNHYVVQGAQDTDLWQRLIDEINASPAKAQA
ncbi:MAG TPA: polyketide biosynthesis protein [Rhodobacteraceae bacterium]|jgi:predicted DsbA family dithiol-disulfide isomerase|nr:DsbA family oxidoreductase [Rhodobacter sp.]HBN31980.1 polyketide biosynthesis protein [Paracoccaceae bacterium]